MSKLPPSSIQFFHERMNAHTKVKSVGKEKRDINLYRLIRTSGLPDVLVYYSNAYYFSTAEFYALPNEIGRNSFVLLQNWSDTDPALVSEAQKSGIAVGKMSKLLGALNRHNIWEYVAPEEQ